MRKYLKVAAGIGFVILVALAAAYLVLGYAPVPEVPKLSSTARRDTLRVGTRDRTFWAYAPEKLPAGAPLLLVLHGSTMTGAQMREWTGFELDALADQRGFVVAYPDGYKGNWNDCRRAAKYPAKLENVDDVGFLKALIAHLHETNGIATDRVYAFGYSNGGQMAFRLAFETPEVLSGLAVAGSTLPSSDNMGCDTSKPTPLVMVVSGTNDPLVPFEGGEVTMFGLASRGFARSAADTAGHFARVNGLTEQPIQATLPAAGTATSVESYTWLRDGAPYVVHYVVKNGGHAVPQRTFRFPRALGETNHDLDMPAKAVELFLGPPT